MAFGGECFAGICDFIYSVVAILNVAAVEEERDHQDLIWSERGPRKSLSDPLWIALRAERRGKSARTKEGGQLCQLTLRY
jgi:hypothetical protein